MEDVQNALNIISNPMSTVTDREQAQGFLDVFQSNTANLATFFSIAVAEDPGVRHYGLTCLTDFHNQYHTQLDMAQLQQFRQSALGLLQSVTPATPPFVKNKVSALIGQMMFREWPRAVSDYPERLGNEAQASPIVQELVMLAFRGLCELVSEELPNMTGAARQESMTAVVDLADRLVVFVTSGLGSAEPAVRRAALGLTAVLMQWMPIPLLTRHGLIPTLLGLLSDDQTRIEAVGVLDTLLKRNPEGQHDAVLPGLLDALPSLAPSTFTMDDYPFVVTLLNLLPTIATHQYSALRPHVPRIAGLLVHYAVIPSHVILSAVITFLLKVLRDDRTRKAIPDELWHGVIRLSVTRMAKEGGPSSNTAPSTFSAVDFCGDDAKWADFMSTLIGRLTEVLRLLAGPYPEISLDACLSGLASLPAPDPGPYPSPSGHCTTRSPGYTGLDGVIHSIEAVVAGIETAATAEGATTDPYTEGTFTRLLQVVGALCAYHSTHAILLFRVLTAFIALAPVIPRIAALPIDGDPVRAVVEVLLDAMRWRPPHEIDVPMPHLSQDTLATRRRAGTVLLAIAVQSPSVVGQQLELIYTRLMSGMAEMDSQGNHTITENERTTLTETLAVASIGLGARRRDFISALISEDYTRWTAALQDGPGPFLAAIGVISPDMVTFTATRAIWSTRRALHFSLKGFVAILRRLMFPAHMSHGRSYKAPQTVEISDEDRGIIDSIVQSILPLSVAVIGHINSMHTTPLPHDPRLDSFPTVEVNQLLGKIGAGSDLKSDMDHPSDDLQYAQYLIHEMYELAATFVSLACRAGTVPAPHAAPLMRAVLPNGRVPLPLYRLLARRLVPDICHIVPLNNIPELLSMVMTIAEVTDQALAAADRPTDRAAIELEMVTRALALDIANGVVTAVGVVVGITTVQSRVTIDEGRVAAITASDSPADMQTTILQICAQAMTWPTAVAAKKAAAALAAVLPGMLSVPGPVVPQVILSTVVPAVLSALADDRHGDFAMEVVGLLVTIQTGIIARGGLDELVGAVAGQVAGLDVNEYRAQVQQTATMPVKKQRKSLRAFLARHIGYTGHTKGGNVAGVTTGAGTAARAEKHANQRQAAEFMTEAEDVGLRQLMGSPG